MDELAAQTSVSSFRIEKFIDIAIGQTRPLSHLDLFCWLQGELQAVLPHDIAVAIWGTAKGAALKFDILSRHPEMRTAQAIRSNFLPFASNLVEEWRGNEEQPLLRTAPTGFRIDPTSHCPISTGFRQMRSCVLHGCQDRRDDTLAVYAFFSRRPHSAPTAREYLRLLTPYIDMAVRKVVPLPHVYDATQAPSVADISCSASLTAREREILHWVRAGKTNEVIGTILGISPFTVKNHLKRVYQKLNVTNRAHAASKF